jgi:hypothetical protein
MKPVSASSFFIALCSSHIGRRSLLACSGLRPAVDLIRNPYAVWF